MNKNIILPDPHILIQRAKTVLRIEADTIAAMIDDIDHTFIAACTLILKNKGRVVVTGMGKSGHIARKIAATLASTGTPAFFMHPAEASHGDLGMITTQDIVLALSHSGESDEVVAILPLLKRSSIPLIALTGHPHSSLAVHADVHLQINIKAEACPLGLAPTASTTAALAMGDALAVALLEARDFTSEDFARSHPGGKLGRRLLLHVENIMASLEETAYIDTDASIKTALIKMTQYPQGIIVIIDSQRHVLGVFTEGDLRRALTQSLDLNDAIDRAMTVNGHVIYADALAVDAIQMMETKRVNVLPVINHDQQLVGVINMHHLLKAKVI